MDPTISLTIFTLVFFVVRVRLYDIFDAAERKDGHPVRDHMNLLYVLWSKCLFFFFLFHSGCVIAFGGH